jgi:hypothetical protein
MNLQNDVYSTFLMLLLTTAAAAAAAATTTTTMTSDSVGGQPILFLIKPS